MRASPRFWWRLSVGRVRAATEAWWQWHTPTRIAPRASLPRLRGGGSTCRRCGSLLDTVDKDGPGLRTLISPQALARWVERAHDAGLLVALAGKLAAEDLAYVRDAGADIAGVRGAACEGGRTGRVSAEKVRRLRTLCGAAPVCRGPAKAV